MSRGQAGGCLVTERVCKRAGVRSVRGLEGKGGGACVIYQAWLGSPPFQRRIAACFADTGERSHLPLLLDGGGSVGVK